MNHNSCEQATDYGHTMAKDAKTKPAAKKPTAAKVGKKTAAKAKPTAKAANKTAAKAGRKPPTRVAPGEGVLILRADDDHQVAVEARPHSLPRIWALAAYVAALELASRDVWDWGAWDAAAARVLYLRTEGHTAHPTDEAHKLLPRPAGFTAWRDVAKRLAEVVVEAPHRARGALKGACRVSPYAVVIADEETHALFDPRGRLEPAAEMLASVDQVGVVDSIKLQTLVEKGRPVEYVGDGRQRINAVRAVNARRIRDWWASARAVGTVAQPPELILEVPAEVLGGSVAEAQRAGGILNAAALRRDDSLRDQAHRAPQLRAAGYKREEIAVQLGVSVSTVTNLLALQQLATSLQRELWAGSLAPAPAYLLATQETAHQLELWALAQRFPAPRRARYLRDLITAEFKVDELRTVVEAGMESPALGERDRKLLAEAEAALERLRSGDVEAPAKARATKDLAFATGRLGGLDGEGPRLVRATLDWANGKGTLEELLELLKGSPATVVGPLGVECPDCSADPGHECWTGFEDEDDDEVKAAGQYHRSRHDAAAEVMKTRKETK